MIVRISPELLTLAQAAKVAGIHQDTLRVQIHNQRLKAQKVGRDWFVTRKDLTEYLDNRWERKPKKRGKP